MIIKEKLNLYLCEHGCHNITVDVDEGVTPFMIRCNFTGRKDRPLNPAKSKNGRCVGMARSCFYPQILPDGAPYPVPTHEWYKPLSLDKINYFNEGGKVLALTEAEKEHVENGGLLLRKRTDKKPILHKEKEGE